ncbi:hypothetical protein GTHT12_02703 [Geobacillus thermodenitrificans]|jgi:hypothetical protein|nr:hypothetical protein GTHT12_02703 [Geobacillus thermodenitrificans]KQB91736.1 hypothetical protein GEPA3_3265 [Geobacillus sp. PA-3]MEC5187983.1 hypothetical protein [Geobacillus thermodenitrificans]
MKARERIFQYGNKVNMCSHMKDGVVMNEPAYAKQGIGFLSPCLFRRK